MAGIRLGGLSSGLDTESLISQLMAAERLPRTRYENKQQVEEARKSTLTDIQSKLKALQTAVRDLRSTTLFAPTQSVATSDDTRVGVTRTGGVGTGAYSVKVTTVAAAEQRSFTYTPPASATTLDVGGHSTALAAGTTLADAISAINGDADAKVYASDVGGKLALSWRATGDASNADTVTGGATSGETLLRAGRNAAFEIDGVPGSSQTNTVTSVPGLTLSLKAPTSADVAITVGAPGPDTGKLKDKLKAFVEAYNAANDIMRTETREERVVGAANRVDRGKGVLRGDSGIAALQAQLRSALSATIATGSTGADQLADLGISTGTAAGSSTFSRDAVNGKLVLDEEKFAATLAAQPTRIKQLLGGTGAGVAQGFESVLDAALGAGGVFEQRLKSSDSEVARLKAQMTAFDGRLDLRERALRATYTRLEQSLSASQSQQARLGAQLG